MSPPAGKISDGTAADGTVAAVLLAAGRSSRLGCLKQLAPWRGEPLVRHAARLLLATSARPVLAVLGHRAGEVAEALADLDVHLVRNSRWSDGQSTSVAAGVSNLPRHVTGALFMPCDQPLLTRETVQRLIDESRRSPHVIVRPRYAGRPGAPVIFPRAEFPRLLELKGDEGGRQILRRRPDTVRDLEVADAHEGLDLDEEADFVHLEERDARRLDSSTAEIHNPLPGPTSP